MKLGVAGGLGVVGSYVVEAAEYAGHEVVILSRRTGIDVLTGSGLDGALKGVDVIIDVLNPKTLRRGPAIDFYETEVRSLHRAGDRAGVQRLIVLSIVGIDKAAGFSYYAAKLAHEKAAIAGALPTSIVRSTQFHEFPAQMLRESAVGRIVMVPKMASQPIAARTVGQLLVGYAVEAPMHQIVEIAGPEPGDMVELTRKLVTRHALGKRVVGMPLPGSYGKAFRGGGLLPGPKATIAGPTFEEWLNSPDSATAIAAVGGQQIL